MSSPWTISQWAPLTFLGVEVNRLGGGGSSTAHSSDYQRLHDAQEFELTSRASSDAPLELLHGPEEASTTSSSTGELSGIYFGILNIFTTLPQFVGTMISTIVFAILEPGKSPELAGADGDKSDAGAEGAVSDSDGPNGIAVCLFIGAISSLYAAYSTRKLRYL